MKRLDQAPFYGALAEYYDLVYRDWERSMQRQGAAISRMLPRSPGTARILDVSAGIGTQALPLAARGYEVVARDLSDRAIDRLRREARDRGLKIDAEVADMRDVGRTVGGLFDAVISFDNSLPHLLTDADILATLKGLSALLAPDGVVLVSIRDYDSVDRSPRSIHSYGERVRRGRRFRVSQEWEWYDPSHYRTTMIVEGEAGAAWEPVVRVGAAYYALSVDRLLELMGEAGMTADRVEDADYFQPVLRGSPG